MTLIYMIVCQLFLIIKNIGIIDLGDSGPGLLGVELRPNFVVSSIPPIRLALHTTVNVNMYMYVNIREALNHGFTVRCNFINDLLII